MNNNPNRGSGRKAKQRNAIIKTVLVAVLVTLGLTLGAWAAEPAAGRSIGFRNDGTGIFPDDCRPPTTFDAVKGDNLAWKVALPNFSNSSPSPLLVDGLLLMYAFDHCWAYDTATGQLRWKTQSGVIRHGMGRPVVLHLPVPGGDGKTESCVFLWTGDLVRVRDGRKLLAEVTKVMFGSMTSDGGQTVYATAYSSAAVEAQSIKDRQLVFPLPTTDRTMALRFTLTGADTAKAEQVWTSAAGLGSYPILYQGKLYTVYGGVVDAATGKALVSGAKGKQIGTHGIILAGGHLYGVPDTSPGWPRANKNNPETMVQVGVAPLATPTAIKYQPLNPMPGLITDPDELKKVVAMTGFQFYKSNYGWHAANSAPFASGNRLFVRDFDFLYCFGDPKQPFTPSEAFKVKP